MGRPVYPYELDDPDFSWLVSRFKEEHKGYGYVESSCLPIVLINLDSNSDIESESDAPEALFAAVSEPEGEVKATAETGK